jgi:hypothetical protein
VKHINTIPLLVALTVLLALAAGCSRPHDEHRHEHGAGATHGHSHGDDAKSFSGATHKEGEGITLLDETRKVLGVEVQEVSEKQVPKEVLFTSKVFAAPKQTGNQTTKTFEAAGTVPREDAVMLKRGTAVSLAGKGKTFSGVVERIDPMPGGEAEVVVSFSAEAEEAQFGEFLEAKLGVEPKEPATAVPSEAVVRGMEGPFVYVVNGDAYLRTLVVTGAEADGFVAVKEGLLAGDSVVSKGALDLWLVELRAVKGGQGCCPAPPVKRK